MREPVLPGQLRSMHQLRDGGACFGSRLGRRVLQNNLQTGHTRGFTPLVLPKIDRNKCVGCGRCYVSCMDGGHQAITFGDDRQPRIVGANCVGCYLCRLVCPTGAIGMAHRMNKPK